jgi:hypothetical protein
MAVQAEILLDTKTIVETEAQPTPATVEQDLIDRTVGFINDKVNESTSSREEVLGQIGVYVLNHIFGGRVEKGSSKSPRKDNSYSQLCSRKDLKIKVSMLSQSVRVAEQDRFLGVFRIDTSGLSFSHKAELIKLKNDDVKAEFVLGIVANPPSSRELAEIVKRMRGGGQTIRRNPKRRLETLRKILNRTEIAELLANPDEALLGDDSVKAVVIDLKEIFTRYVTQCDDFIAASERSRVE